VAHDSRPLGFHIRKKPFWILNYGLKNFLSIYSDIDFFDKIFCSLWSHSRLNMTLINLESSKTKKLFEIKTIRTNNPYNVYQSRLSRVIPAVPSLQIQGVKYQRLCEPIRKREIFRTFLPLAIMAAIFLYNNKVSWLNSKCRSHVKILYLFQSLCFKPSSYLTTILRQLIGKQNFYLKLQYNFS
jgi:isocitrate dehydrogenase kinase/phosphatase